MDLQHNFGTYATTNNSLHFINLLIENERTMSKPAASHLYIVELMNGCKKVLWIYCRLVYMIYKSLQSHHFKQLLPILSKSIFKNWKNLVDGILYNQNKQYDQTNSEESVKTSIFAQEQNYITVLSTMTTSLQNSSIFFISGS